MAIDFASNPPYKRVRLRNPAKRAVEVLILLLLLCFLAYRLLELKNHDGPAWLLALFCESCFTLVWVLVVSTKWTPVDYETYPSRLLQRVSDLPPVDLFVTTADPTLEPPIITANTVLSLMAVDYPADKLACYVSDDGCSPLTFYSLMEAAKFAELWIPFCKKYNIPVRAPFRYFSSDTVATAASGEDFSMEFQRDRDTMRDEYEKLSKKIEEASNASVPCDLSGEFADFANTERRHHPSIIKVW